MKMILLPLLNGLELAIVWATGFRPAFGWVEADVFDARGRPRHARGVTEVPGLYFLGLPWQHTRGSALLGWVGRDAEWLAGRIGEVTNENHEVRSGGQTLTS